ncbi:hypothetical protein BZG36_01942 [Bifiguratus adelaidae]|uniref:Gfo/Idh/MocA-like oxidoreductase N-terminal domain-containing protein n=1 Tax=Bifiguratus adelaidae TaxID=1938954 RepID=A0A261Y3V7_9FUNG|nr:hypothetical protein BZG36_01942 [Bifiguratus adelaidae]
MAELKKLNVLMVGTGEYTTGFVHDKASTSDKKVGVVALTMFDLRRRGKVGEISMVGTNGSKMPRIREHLDNNIGKVYHMDTSLATFPKDGERDPESYKAAIDQLSPGDAITVFTPDPTHYDIALYAIRRQIHVLLTKPAVKSIEHHNHLVSEAKKHNVLVMVEHHKRFDPAYSDAKGRSENLGEFGFFSSYMSQPKKQLDTFRSWAGKESDISYYLNSHHIDMHCWMVSDTSVPYKVTASAATGVASSEPFNLVAGTEDTITLLTNWHSMKHGNTHQGTAVYTASWTAPSASEVHSQQHFHYLAEKGEIRVDQAHRGYSVTTDEVAYANLNPFYMKYTPDEDGHFDGQRGYGYISLEKFVDLARKVNQNTITLDEIDQRGLPTIRNTAITTAILEAGRRSLDEKRSVGLEKHADGSWAIV